MYNYHTLTPKFSRQVRLKTQCAPYIAHMSMFLLDTTIFVRSFNHRGLMNNNNLRKLICQASKFFLIITSYNFYFGIKLAFNHSQ